MQFSLSKLFGVTAAASIALGFLSPVFRHWDLRSYAIGFYGSANVPEWAAGTGQDQLSQSLGAFFGLVWSFGPWVGICGVAALGVAAVANMKGGAR